MRSVSGGERFIYEVHGLDINPLLLISTGSGFRILGLEFRPLLRMLSPPRSPNSTLISDMCACTYSNIFRPCARETTAWTEIPDNMGGFLQITAQESHVRTPP